MGVFIILPSPKEEPELQCIPLKPGSLTVISLFKKHTNHRRCNIETKKDPEGLLYNKGPTTPDKLPVWSNWKGTRDRVLLSQCFINC